MFLLERLVEKTSSTRFLREARRIAGASGDKYEALDEIRKLYPREAPNLTRLDMESYAAVDDVFEPLWPYRSLGRTRAPSMRHSLMYGRRSGQNWYPDEMEKVDTPRPLGRLRQAERQIAQGDY